MPNNINHVVVGNETKLDLREDTVTPSTMVNGIVAHDASGVRIVGTFDPSIFVQKSGDTMTGPLTFDTSNTNAIRYAGTYATHPMIKFKDGMDQYGNGIIIGGGGLTVVGGGEAADTIASSRSAGTEELHLAADGAVAIWSNVNNGEASAKKFLFDTSGDLTVARYCRANYYNQSSGDESGQLSNSSFAMFANSDGFLRKTSLAQLGNKMPLYDGNVSWGGANVAADYRPADAAFCDALSGNRFAGIDGSAVTVEYSRDGGSTWTAYPDSTTARKRLFTTSSSYGIGANDASHKATSSNNYRLRVTVDTGAGSVYSTINKFIIQVSTNGSNNCRVTIQKALQNSLTSFSNVVENVSLGGWSGYNVVNLGREAFTTYGNQATTQYGRVRFIFAADSGNTNYTGMQVLSIYGYGGFGWTTPSTLAKTGHVYSYDDAMNVTFPAALSAASINASTLTGAYIVNDYTSNSGTKGKPLFNYRDRAGTLKTTKLPAVSGSVTINPNNVTSVSFGTTFSMPPHVIAQYATTGGNANGDWGSIKISSITETGFNAVIGGSSPSSAVIDWFAIWITNA